MQTLYRPDRPGGLYASTHTSDMPEMGKEIGRAESQVEEQLRLLKESIEETEHVSRELQSRLSVVTRCIPVEDRKVKEQSIDSFCPLAEHVFMLRKMVEGINAEIRNQIETLGI